MKIPFTCNRERTVVSTFGRSFM